ncbi:hypothetical protein MBLNU230_g4372t1 [Neophaeotheca triangularis]
MPIQRITCFKVPDKANIQPILDAYKVVASSNEKDGKAYIISCTAGQTFDDPRRQGYDIVATTTFHSLADMQWYDTDCPAHQQVKAAAKGKIEPPPLCVYYEI